MKLRFLGGAREVGRSAILVNDRLLLDCGSKTGEPPGYPLDLRTLDPEAVVVSHGHLDHVGALPALLSGDSRPPIHWTPPTDELARLLARDTLKLHGGTYDCPFTEVEVERLTQVSEHHGYCEPFEAAGHRVTFFDAGHIPGSAQVRVHDGDTRRLYTGDFYTEPAEGGEDHGSAGELPGRGQRLVPASTARPEADVVLTESTYADVTREPRARIEQRFVRQLKETVAGGGTVVVPAFAIGRTQEVMLVCAAHDVDCYVDGMGTEVTRILRRHPAFVRDADALGGAAANAREVTGRDGQRRRIADKPGVIVTTSGMLQGGPAMTYVPEIRSNPANLVAVVGYQVEGTPGRRLLETGRAEFDGRVVPVSARVELFDFSAHADRDGLLWFLSAYDDAEVLVNHGDRCPAFAGELRERDLDASAPERGDVVRI